MNMSGGPSGGFNDGSDALYIGELQWVSKTMSVRRITKINNIPVDHR